jgi:hypothetical protein
MKLPQIYLKIFLALSYHTFAQWHKMSFSQENRKFLVDIANQTASFASFCANRFEKGHHFERFAACVLSCNLLQSIQNLPKNFCFHFTFHCRASRPALSCAFSVLYSRAARLLWYSIEGHRKRKRLLL